MRGMAGEGSRRPHDDDEHQYRSNLLLNDAWGRSPGVDPIDQAVLGSFGDSSMAGICLSSPLE